MAAVTYIATLLPTLLGGFPGLQVFGRIGKRCRWIILKKKTALRFFAVGQFNVRKKKPNRTKDLILPDLTETVIRRKIHARKKRHTHIGGVCCWRFNIDVIWINWKRRQMNYTWKKKPQTHIGRMALVHLVGHGPGLALGVPWVVVVGPFLPLVAGQRYVTRVDHHHVIAAVAWRDIYFWGLNLYI